MFTGIIETVGRVAETRDVQAGRQLWIDTGAEWLREVAVGDSIAVDGACLTVAQLRADSFRADLVLSTLERTVAGAYTVGQRVNLERAMVLGTRLDGHLVQGHVDGVGTLASVQDEGGTRFLEFDVPDAVWAQTLLHGSICLNGISLTVNALRPPCRVEVAIIPHTWQVTNLSDLEPGAPVNVEGDQIGKYVQRILSTQSASSDSSRTH